MVEPQSLAKVTWQVTDTDGNALHTITPSDPGSLQCREGVRTVRGFEVFPDADFDPYDHRLVPTWEGETTEALGVFVAAPGTRRWITYQNPSGPTVGYVTEWNLQDLTKLLDPPLVESVGLAQGALPNPLIETLLASRGFTTWDLANFTAGATEPSSWAAGRDSPMSVIEDLMASVGGRFYIDRDGIPTTVPVPLPEDTTADRTFNTGTGTVLGNPEYATDPWAPNRFQAVAGTDTGEIVATYDLPADFPNSYANRGMVILERFDVSATSQGVALQAAQARAVDSVRNSETVNLAVVPTPDMEAWEAIAVDGLLYTVSEFGFGLSGDTVQDLSAGLVLGGEV